MADTIISLTTIPTRFDHIDAALGNLVNQTADIDEIRLYIPRRYRRFPEMEISQPKVRKGVRVCMVDDDFGPATKILPAVSDFAGQDVNILFCDDDQQASPDFARRFLDARAEHPNYCIVERGYELSDRPVGSPYYPKHTYFPRVGKRRKDLAYRLKRAASLLQYKLPPFSKSGFVDVLEGFGGVLVKPDFFPPEVFDIPDILWTVDDLWLSGHLTRNGVPIWLNAVNKPWKEPYYTHFHDPLTHYVYKGNDRLAADTACIEYMRSTYGIWADERAPDSTMPVNA